MAAQIPLGEDIAGFQIFRGWLDTTAQTQMVRDLRDVIRQAPLVRPMTAWGKPMSVRMTSAGRAGWVIERGRYRYAAQHPELGTAWPQIPETVLAAWRQLAGWPDDPDCCLINWYTAEARMGLHQDKDEDAFDAPVLSISLGDPARFRMGGPDRKDKTVSTILNTGDVVLMGGAARLAFHGVDRVLTDTPENPLTGRGRINLTLRVVSQDVLARA